MSGAGSRLTRLGLGVATQAQHAFGARAFTAASLALEATQRERLRALLRANAGSAYGRALGLGQVTSFADFQRRIPISDWNAVSPWVDRAMNGEAQVLTREPVTHFERTSGSTAGPKHVPYTRSLMAEFHRGFAPWFHGLGQTYRGLWEQPQYWSLSQAMDRVDRTAGGHRIGVEDDTAYVGPLARWATRKLLAVPIEVAKSPTADEWRARTLRHLVQARDLGFVSVWSPSFFTLLLEALEARLPSLLAELRAGDREGIERRLQREGRFTAEAIWPRLRVVSCWMDASAAAQVPGLRRFLARTPLQPKGLGATEGIVTIPLEGVDGGVLAAGSHVYEFLDLDAPGAVPLAPSALRVGGHYSPLLTTAGGLVRYQLHDALLCTGHFRQLPVLRFEGRVDRTADLVGEKVTAAEIERALADVKAPFRLVVAEPGPPARYQLFVEATAEAARAHGLTLERRLMENVQYRDARRLEQLQAVQVLCVEQGWDRYVARLESLGMKRGDIKPASLELRSGWREALRGVPLEG